METLKEVPNTEGFTKPGGAVAAPTEVEETKEG